MPLLLILRRAAVIGSAAGVLTAMPAAATTVAPWEPTAAASGVLTFYDASGLHITNGSANTAPFAAYAVGSGDVRAGDDQAGLYFANPSDTETPPNWYVEAAGSFTGYPVLTGPADIQTLSRSHPVATGEATDETLDLFESDSVISTTAGYQDVIQIRLRTSAGPNGVTSGYDDADLMIDPTAHTWTQIYPSDPAATSPSVSGRFRVAGTVRCQEPTASGETVGYKWMAGGTVLSHSSRLTVPAPAFGRQLTCAATVTVTTSGLSATASSRPRLVGTGPALSVVTPPRLRGPHTVGAVERATAGRWRPTAGHLTYQWYLGHKLIAGAHSSRLTLRRSQAGKRLSCKVSAAAHGYAFGHAITKTVRIRAT